LSPTSHFLLRLRILHPTVSIIVGIYLILAVGTINLNTSQRTVRRFARLVTVLVVVQLGAGFINVLLLAPVWMQLVHLLLADSVWIGLVLLSAATFAQQAESVPEKQPQATKKFAAG
ncbi:MAG: COX15/CtaA family protein, partial [Anaerolineales bacterium]